MPLLGRYVAGLAEAVSLRIATETPPTAIAEVAQSAPGELASLGADGGTALAHAFRRDADALRTIETGPH